MRTAIQTSLIEGLNQDLQREYQAIIRYNQFAATVLGPSRPYLAELFRNQIGDEIGHAAFLANKIAALGGEPSIDVPPVRTAGDPREMLAAVAQAELEDVQFYTRRAQQAEEGGDVALRVHLENIVADERRHLEEIQKILDGWV